jgi:MFS family permease
MQFVVIEWQVYSLTKDPLSLGIIGLMEVIPAVSLALFAGHVVDQKEKKGLLVKCILGFSAISLGLFLLTWPKVTDGWSPTLVLWAIYLLVFAGGAVRAFLGPTIFALFSLLVPKRVYPNAATWSSSVWQMAAVLGPALAGFSISWIGVHWSMCLIFWFSLMAFLFLTRIPKKPILNPKIGEPVMDSLKEGVKFVWNTKVILGAITLDMIAVLFGGAVALLPIYAQDILKVGAEGFGILRAAPAVGALIIMFTAAYFPLNKKAGIKLLASIFGFGLCISMIIRQTILQLRTPDEMRGRVAAVNSMFVGSSNELGAFESGITAKWMGTVTAVVFGGCMTIFTVVTTAFAFPAFRKLDLRKDMEEHEAS